MRMMVVVLSFLAFALSLSHAQGTAANPPAVAAQPPPSPVSGIRNKLSAGDLLSAESILEVHRAKNGQDSTWLLGLSWLARGAMLLDDTAKARRYASEVLRICAERLAQGADLVRNHDLEIPFGAAVEVEAQRLERTSGASRAAEYLQGELQQVHAPVTLVARLNKRLNMIALEGKPAPEFAVEDFIGAQPPALGSLRGKPVLIFLWYEGCGDCKAQAAALARAKARYQAEGLQVVTLTRYYEEEGDHGREKTMIDSVWKAVYADVGTVPIVISTASVERYGGSSTPTFIFLDREGIVRRYTPTRLTEEELEATIGTLFR